MEEDVLFHFNKSVDDYNTVATKVVMKNNEIYSVIINSIPFFKSSKKKVLNLGCRTTDWIDLLFKKYPNLDFTGMNFSSRVIENLKIYNSKYPSNFNFLVGDFLKDDFGEGYDLIISDILLHNFSHEDKISILRKIHSSLKKGGYFINGDFIEGEDEFIDGQYRLIYKDFLEKNLKGEELDVWLAHSFGADIPMSLSKQFKLLKRIGLQNTRLLWQFNNEAIYITQK